MDPYLLSRIGDVTIQRVLPKQDQPKTDHDVAGQSSPTDSPAEELDLSLKNQTKRDDEGGGTRLGEINPDLDYADASDEDNAEDSDMDDDEQDLPLSLVTARGSKKDNSSHINQNITNTNIPSESGGNFLNLDESVKETDEFNQNKLIQYESMENERINEQDKNQYSEENSDNDEDNMSLSRLLQNVNQDDSFQTEQGDETNDKSMDNEEQMGDGEEDYEGAGDDEDIGQEEEDQGEDGEAEIKTEPQDEDDQEQEEGKEENREMIVIKQEEMFNEESEGQTEDDGNEKRKLETEEEEKEGDPTTKKSKKGTDESGSDSEGEDQTSKDQKSCEKKLMNLRKNIREVMDENQLDEATLSAQRQEMERLQRVQEQQRIIREVNRQINLNKQSNNVISLLQGGSGTSLLKVSTSSSSTTPTPKSTSPNTVLVKLSSGSGPPQVVNKKVLEILKSTRSAEKASSSSKASALANKLLNKPSSLTSSVSIAPVKPGLTITKLGKPGEDKTAGKSKQKGKDVVMISSSSSDEDDCIVISGGEEEQEEEEEDDPTNSGMHTNDTYNVPDDQGRVLINVGRPENEPEVFLAPQIAKIIKPHQIGGVRFLFDNIVESLDRFKNSPGFGCILAHSMGLGKTLQVVSFCDVFLRYTEGKTVLCIMPINTLQNWLAEFNMWLPVEPSTSPFATQGIDVQPRTFPLFVLNDLQKSMVQRAKVVIQWAKEGGVLLIGYELYRQLSLHKPRKKPIVRKRKINPDDDIDDEKNKHLLEEMHSALVKPGPDLVICDEGHRIKNSHASISQALKQIRSKRRVVLTGYPLQNNLLEYWCMVDFVRPNYLGSKTEFSNMFERPIQNGQCVDSTPQDVRLMRYRAHVLHSLLKGFVQRRSHSVLTNALPQKEEYVILVRMTTFQRKLYDTFMNEVVRTKAVPNPLKAFAVCCKIWNHPDVLYHFLRRRNADAEAVDLDLEETAGALVPAVPGMGNPAINPVLPVKRARGRSPKGTSPKRERKVNPRKRGGTEPDSPVKNPMVAAVMPNTTNSNLQSCESSSLQSTPPQQSDVKPPMPMFSNSQPSRPPFNQYPPNNPAYQPQYQSNYPGFNQPPQNDFHNAPPYNQGFQNQPGYQNNQNMYSGFGGGYYPPQDPTFSGGNYWNNPYNDPNNPSSFSNFNETDPNSSGFYNQDMMGPDGFNAGHRGFNSGMSMNHPGMRGMNPMQSNRMMNNPNQNVMGMNTNMNSMGMQMNNMGMNQSTNYGMGMNTMNQGPQNMGMNPNQGMGVNQPSMGSFNQMSMNNQSVGMNVPGMASNNINQTSQSNPHNNPNPNSGSLHTMTNVSASRSSAESQQEAAIQNIANNLMMSSQQMESSNNPSSRPNSQNPQDMLGNNSLTVLGNSSSIPSSSQNLMTGVQHQTGQVGGVTTPQGQGNSNLSGDGQSQPIIQPSQNSHMIGNMISNTPQSLPGQVSSNNMQSMNTFTNDPQNMQSQNMYGNQSNPNNPSNFSQNPQNVNLHNQQSYNQPNMQSPMIRNQQPNQNMFGQQSSSPMMGSQQSMFGNNSQQMQNMMNPSQNPRMNMVPNQPNMMNIGNMSGFGQTGAQNMFNSGNQPGMMTGAQNPNMLPTQEIPSSSSTGPNSQQTPNTMSRNQQDGQNMFGNQQLLNPMGNLQNMLNNQNMMSSQNLPPSKNDHAPSSDQNQQSHMGINQSNSTASQPNLAANQGGLINQQNNMNDHMSNPMNLPNPQQNISNASMNPLMDNQQNMFGMNSNQMSQSNFMNNQNMHGSGNNMMGSSQNMGMMNNSSGFGMYGNQMNQEMSGGNTGMMGNQMNPNFGNNQAGSSGNMMGVYNQPGMMNYSSGMMMGNQMNNFGMMSQSTSNMNNPMNPNQSYGNNMMRNPPNMLGMRNPQPDVMSNNYPSNQNNFGMIANNSMASNNFNQNPNNPTPKIEPNTFPSTSDNSNSRFMSGGDYMSSGNQINPMNQGNASQGNFNNEYGSYNLNNAENKMWDDISNKPAASGGMIDKKESFDHGGVKSETEMSSQENKLKTEEEHAFGHFSKPKTEIESGSEKKEGEDQKGVDSKKEGSENETKEVSEDNKPAVTPATGTAAKTSTREDATIPYDWATELLKDYEPNHIEASAKFALFFCILEESMVLGDRVLVFSQSLFTLNLIEEFLQRTELPGRQERWAKNWNYYRLDGSTSAIEREKLINEFNSNPNIHLFLVSTRAGSLGINLVGANRVVVLDASWNPCHDTQAVCRVYRYGQRKPCFVYRLVTDNCLEKKIYDRQVNKQGMADRVVDECNPDAHLSIKEVTNLCWDNEEDTNAKDFSDSKDKFIDVVMQKMVERYGKFLSKEPFQHESLLVDRKDKKLSQAEKRLAKRSYELEKQQANTRPTYGYYPGNTSGVGRGNPMMKPMASVRPMQSDMNNQLIRDATSGRPRQWIPAEVWQKQGMSAQEMTLPLDVVIPTNSPERSSIVLKAGQKVMVLKSPKGIYMQLENGKIIAIRTAFKVGGKDKKGTIKTDTTSGIKKMVVQPTRQRAPASLLPLRNNSNISIIPRGGGGPRGPNRSMIRLLGPRGAKQPVATARPYNFGEGVSHPPVTVTVTKKRVPVSGASTSTSSAQVEVRREPKQVTVTPIPHPSHRKTAELNIPATLVSTSTVSETLASSSDSREVSRPTTPDLTCSEVAESSSSESREAPSTSSEPQF